MADKYEVIANSTIDAIGGPSNVASYTNCMTRLRIVPRNAALINDGAVKAIPGVMGTVQGPEYQVILGPGAVTKVADHFGRITSVRAAPAVEDVYYEDLGPGTSAESLAARGAQLKAEQKARNNTPFKNFLRHIGAIFIPLIPAFVGAGLIGGIANIILNLITAGHITSPFWMTLRTVMGVMQNALFAYLMIYIGINAAKEFGATPALGGLIAGITLLNGVTAGPLGAPCPPDTPGCLTNIFNGNSLQAGYGGVLGVLLAVWLLSVVEKALRRFIPDSLDIILTPLIAILIVGLLTIFLIMP
ncbi:MAG: PTS transporter subunit EIIC, partial [Cellulomonadaceae bacterium]|nr:PTS transporter subunit EIIC [Cellulomonadaceae bacterium]